MTQQRFEELKKWVEINLGYELTDDYAFKNDDGCYFSALSGSDTISLCINNDESAEVWLLRSVDEDLEIYATNAENNHLCLGIFCHIVYHR